MPSATRPSGISGAIIALLLTAQIALGGNSAMRPTAGATGSTGATGEQGIQGIQGITGSTGATGAADASASIITALTVTGNTTVSIPAGNIIQDLVIENTTGNAVTGGIKIGTTNGGTDVVLALAVGSNSLQTVLDAALLKRVFSMSGSTTLYVQTVTLWNSASLNLYFSCRKVN